MRLRDWFRTSRAPAPTPTTAPSRPTVSAVEAWDLMCAALLAVIADRGRRDRFSDLLAMVREGVAVGNVEDARGRVWQIDLLLANAPDERERWRKTLASGDIVAAAQRAADEAARQPRVPSAKGVVLRDLMKLGAWFPGDSITVTRFRRRRPHALGRFHKGVPDSFEERER